MKREKEETRQRQAEEERQHKKQEIEKQEQKLLVERQVGDSVFLIIAVSQQEPWIVSHIFIVNEEYSMLIFLF